MKSVLGHIIVTFTITSVLSLFYVMGYSTITFANFVIAVLISYAVINVGRITKLDTKLSKTTVSEGNMHLLRVFFVFILLPMPKVFFGYDPMQLPLTTQNGIVVLWLWVVIEVFINGVRGYLKYNKSDNRL